MAADFSIPEPCEWTTSQKLEENGPEEPAATNCNENKRKCVQSARWENPIEQQADRRPDQSYRYVVENLKSEEQLLYI